LGSAILGDEAAENSAAAIQKSTTRLFHMP